MCKWAHLKAMSRFVSLLMPRWNRMLVGPKSAHMMKISSVCEFSYLSIVIILNRLDGYTTTLLISPPRLWITPAAARPCMKADHLSYTQVTSDRTGWLCVSVSMKSSPNSYKITLYTVLCSGSESSFGQLLTSHLLLFDCYIDVDDAYKHSAMPAPVPKNRKIHPNSLAFPNSSLTIWFVYGFLHLVLT